MALALAVGAYALSLAPRGALGPPWLLGVLAGAAFVWVLRSPLDVRRDDFLPALAVLVSALGLATLARLSSDLARKQELFLLLALVLATAAGPAFTAFRRFAAFKYIWVIGSIVLFLIVAVFGQEVNGAKLWVRIGPLQFEPVELIKLFIVLFMAGYLAETADVISAAKPWSLRANLKYLGPLFLGWATSMAILVFERDIGMASLLLATFAAMLYVATRRVDLIVGGAALFGLAVWFATRHYPYVIARFAVWRNPFDDPLGRGYQALQGLFSLAAGGLFGTGYGLGHPDYIPAVGTDYIFAAWSEEFGAFGGIVLTGVFLVTLLRAIGVARAQPDLYAKLLASGLAVTLGFQVFIIIGGVLGLFPLTGITLPFFSYGGSSLVANFLLIALVWAIGSDRTPRAQSTG
jgi:cell division protein FtsW (lipid II flippase)